MSNLVERTTPANWNVQSNDGTTIVAKNNVTGEVFNGSLASYNAIFKADYVEEATPRWVVDNKTKDLVGYRKADGSVQNIVQSFSTPGGGVEKFTVSGIRRADGTVAPVLDTGDGWELLNGWHPNQLFDGAIGGAVFDNRYGVYADTNGTPAAQGGSVAARSDRVTNGYVRPAKNELPYSEQPAAWTSATNCVVAEAVGHWTLRPTAADGRINANVNRTAGQYQTCAVEVKSGGCEWVFIGPGGNGQWINIVTGATKTAAGAGYSARLIDSTDGYKWVVVGSASQATATGVTNMRVYPSQSEPTSAGPQFGGPGDGVGVLQLRRSYYSNNQLSADFVPSDYNITDAVPPSFAFVGNFALQTDPAKRPTLVGNALTFAAGQDMTCVFSVAPGVGATIGRAVPGVGAQITTDTVGVQLTISSSDAALVVVGKSLSATESQHLRDWLNIRALGV